MYCDSARRSDRPYNPERMAYMPERGSWPAPLPDLSQPAINHLIRIGPHVFRIAISSIQRDVPRQPDTHLVQISVTYDDRPLTAAALALPPPTPSATSCPFL